MLNDDKHEFLALINDLTSHRLKQVIQFTSIIEENNESITNQTCLHFSPSN